MFDDMEEAFSAAQPHVQQHFGAGYVSTRKYHPPTRKYDVTTRKHLPTRRQMFDRLVKVGLGSSAIHVVTDAYEHALCARFPRTRYVVGMDANLLFIPLSYLPDCLADMLLVYCYPFNRFLA
ncbi:hypothetical protein BaRGS_00025378 [Batillaria attramentaria]|uniref:Uncharacterized protein n=1 Tax=Batillaria attramentaria TaxID=370345 RepID=A0ABD0K8Q7_9CAEN